MVYIDSLRFLSFGHLSLGNRESHKYENMMPSTQKHFVCAVIGHHLFFGKCSVSLAVMTTVLSYTIAKPLGPVFCWKMIKFDEEDVVSFIHGEVHM